MNLFELSAKISVDDSAFKKSMENAQKVSNNVANAMKELQSPLDKAKSGFNAIAHPIETAKANFEKLKNATEAMRHPIETFKAKVQESSTALETQRNKLSVLASSYDSAKKKVDELTKEFNKSAKESGTSSEKTKKLADELKKAEKEAEEAKKEMDDYAQSVSKAGKNSEDAKEKISKLANGLGTVAKGIGSGLVTAAKVGTAAVGAAATGIVALTKSAVESYAEYEQLVGGVETLFQGSQKSFDEFTKSIGTSWSDIAKYQKEAGLAVTGRLDTSTLESLQAKYEDMSKAMANAHNVVLENAANAYKTAGMSANEYMSTVTSFSASLIQSLGGDTAAAAEYADRAIISMSDNANKMGTSIDMIQNAYQGFAKQNYTMLDNLKLGYGGTKTEMERLIEDASKMADVQERLGITVDESSMSFDNIVNAIQVVQENMGIAGATALEAGTTIEGSVNSMKAAWQNLLTGISDGNADVGKLMDNFVTTIVGDGTKRNLGVLGNVLPTVKTALNGIGKLIKEAVPVAMQYIPQIIGEFLPTIADAAIGIVTSIGTAIFDNIDQILEWGQQMLDTLLEGINSNAGNISGVVTQIITTFGNFILENLPEIIMAGFTILGSLISGLIEAIPELATAATKAIIELAAYLISAENLEKLISLGGELINALSEGIENVVAELVSVGEKVVESIKSGISSAWGGLVSWFNGIWNSLFGDRTVSVSVKTSHSGGGGSFANGLSYVPYDGFPAILHEGERVLTAEENKAYNSGETGNTSGITIIQNIQAVPQTPVEFAAATEAYFEQARWAFA